MPDARVCLTFDFDAISLWLARGQHSPGAISRGEFGAHAIDRILRLLRERDLSATFFIPGHTVETYPSECVQIVEGGHEVALHGYLHEPVSQLNAEAEAEVSRRALDAIHRVTGFDVRGNRTPSWDFTESTVPVMLDWGCEYDSSLMATDYTPYHVRQNDQASADGPYEFGEPTDIVELPVAWSLDDYPQFEYFRSDSGVLPGLRRPSEVFANFYDDILYMTQTEPSGVCVLTFHPQVIGRGHRMLAFQEFLDSCLALPLEFATCLQVAQEWRDDRAREGVNG